MSIIPTSSASVLPQVPAVGAPPIATPTLALETGAPDVAATLQASLPLDETVDTARAAAAGRQSSLAPLLGNLTQALTATDLPPTLRAAIDQVLALRTPTERPITAETLRQAVAQSGLFLEAGLAQGRPPEPDLKAALLTLLAALPAAGGRSKTSRPDTPPPMRGGTLTGRAPSAATLPAGADLTEIGDTLRGEAEAAVARQVLHQLASLPDSEGAKWLFELPLATPQGAALAQFEIERDDPEHAAPDTAPVWRARFAIDVEPVGPVQVHLNLGDGRMAIHVWAARQDGLDRLRVHAGDLAEALDADVAFRGGQPPGGAPGPGRFVDQTS